MLDEYPYLGYCCYAYDCEKYQNRCTDCREDFSERYMKSLFFNRAKETYLIKEKDYSSINNIVFTGPEWVVNRAKKSSLLRERDVRVVDEFVDNKEIFIIKETEKLRRKLAIPDDKVILLDVAPSSDPRKGVQYFIEVARKIEKVSDRFVFVNVGYLGDHSDIPNNFIGIGYISDQNKLAEYYSLADLFVCTSIADTMPNSCLDAMSCGTPILGFDITGIPYVADPPIGRFVNPKDVDAIMKSVLNTDKKTDNMKKMCREYALRRYSIDTYYDKQMNIYNEMVKRDAYRN